MKFCFLALLFLSAQICAHAATFTEPSNSTLRIASYNVMQDRIHEGRSREASWARMVTAIKADIWMLQEMFYGEGATTAEGNAFRDTVENITGQNDWNYSWDAKGRYLLTRYPIMWDKELHHRVHATWIDLPSNVSSKDLVVINVHFKNSTVNQTAAAVDLINEIRGGNHSAGIPADVSIIVCGDFNQTSTQSAYQTLVGNKGFVDVNPSHIEANNQKKTIGSVSLDGNGNWTSIGNNQIDFVLFDSSVFEQVNAYVLNTLIMKQSDLNASGLRRADVAIEPDDHNDFTNVNIACDHFAIIADFNAGGNSGNPTIPVVSFESPTTTLVAGQNLQLRVKASDPDNIDRVYLYKNGVQLSRSEGGAPYDFGAAGQNDPELQNLQAGVYTFKAVARDNVGDEGQATITVTVNPAGDTVKPVVSFASPTTTLLAGQNLQLTVNASDANGIDRVYLYKNGVQLSRSEGGAPYDFGAAGQNDTELQNLQAGVYTFKAVAKDPAGNEGEATITVTVNPIGDTVKPVVSFASPTTTLNAGENLQLTVNASDSNGIDRVYLYKDGVELARSEGAAPYDFGLASQNDPEMQNLQPGVYQFKAVAKDPAGNEGEATINVTVLSDATSLIIEAEDFDVNSGFQTQATSDVGGGQNIGYTDVGDYVEYHITVDSAGTYEVIFRVASFSQGAKFDLKDGNTILCSVNEPATGGFQNWVTTAPQVINLPAGDTDLRILATGPSWNMNWFELTPLYLVKIQAEDFDSTVGFGTQGTTDVGGGGNLKDATAGDTATYLNVNIPVSGTYEATFRIASLNQPVRFDLNKGNTTLVTVDQPATGGYQIWTSWTTPEANRFYLPAGNSTLTIKANGVGWNLNWFDLKLVD